MRDKEVGEGELFLEVAKEVDDLCLDGDIESSDRFIEDEEGGL